MTKEAKIYSLAEARQKRDALEAAAKAKAKVEAKKSRHLSKNSAKAPFNPLDIEGKSDEEVYELLKTKPDKLAFWQRAEYKKSPENASPAYRAVVKLQNKVLGAFIFASFGTEYFKSARANEKARKKSRQQPTL